MRQNATIDGIGNVGGLHNCHPTTVRPAAAIGIGRRERKGPVTTPMRLG
jgi:hypothetical protein